jgi:hypothetical protein
LRTAHLHLAKLKVFYLNLQFLGDDDVLELCFDFKMFSATFTFFGLGVWLRAVGAPNFLAATASLFLAGLSCTIRSNGFTC